MDKKWIGEYNDFVGIYHKAISSDLCNSYLEFYNWAITNNYADPSWKPGTEFSDGVNRRDESIHSAIKFLQDEYLFVYKPLFINNNYKKSP